MDNDPLGLLSSEGDTDPLGILTKAPSVGPLDDTLDIIKGAVGRVPFNMATGLAADVHGQASRLLYNLDIPGKIAPEKFGTRKQIPWEQTKDFQADVPQWEANTPAGKQGDKLIGEAWDWIRQSAGSGAVSFQEAVKKIKPRLGFGMGQIFVSALENLPEEAVRSIAEGTLDFGALMSMGISHGKPGVKTPSSRETLIQDQLQKETFNKGQQEKELAGQRDAAEANKGQEFQGAQQDPLDLLPQEMKSPYNVDPTKLETDPYSGMPFDAARSQELAKTEMADHPVDQGDLFTGQTPDNPQFPIEDSMPKKVVPELGLEQTPEKYQGDFRMEEKAGQEPGVGYNPLAEAVASKPTLGPGVTTIPYEKTGIPFETLNKEPIPSSQKPRYIPYNKQRGMADASVFLEGLSKMLGRAPKSLEGAKGMLEAKLDDAMNRRDTFMAPAYREKLKQIKDIQHNEFVNKTIDDEANRLYGQTRMGRSQRGGPKQEKLLADSRKFISDVTGDKEIPFSERLQQTRDLRDQIRPYVLRERSLHAEYLRTKDLKVAEEYHKNKAILDRMEEQYDRLMQENHAIGQSNRLLGEMKIGRKQRGAVGDLTKDEWKAKERLKSGEVKTLTEEELAKQPIPEGMAGTARPKGKNVTKMMAERETVLKAQAGDAKAFESLFTASVGRLEKYARQFKLDDATAMDLIQDAMLKAYEKIKDFNPEIAQFNTWVTTILDRKIEDYKKHERKFGGIELTDEQSQAVTPRTRETPESILEERQTGEGINRAWEKLGDEDRQILNLKDLEDLTFARIADLLEISVEAAKKRAERARDVLKANIRAEGVGRPKGYFGGPGGKQRGAIILEMPDFLKKLKSKGPAGAALELRDQFDISPHDITDVVKSNPNNFKPENLKDFDKGIDSAILNVAIDKTISIISATKGGLGELVKWARDGRSEIDRVRGVVVRDHLDSVVGRGSAWGKMKRNGNLGHQHLQDFTKLVVSNIGKRLDSSAFKTTTQYEAYIQLKAVFDRVADDINIARSKFPTLKQIVKKEGFFPAEWNGDYVINVKDGMDRTVFQKATNSRAEAISMQEALAKEYPNHSVKWFESGNSKYHIKSLQGFEEALRTLDPKDPTYQGIRQAYLDILSKRSFGRHAAESKGVGGFMGTEGGKLGVKHFEEAVEQYIKGAYNYIGNLDKQAMKEQFANLDPAIREKIPNGVSYINEYLDMAKGSDISREQLIRGIAEWMSSTVGRGKSGPENLIGRISSTASLFWLATPRFYMANLVQSINSLPKMVEIAGRPGFEGANPMHAMWEGITQTISPDAAAKEAMSWAEKNGYMESSLVSMFNLNVADLHQTKLGFVGDIASWSQQKWEHHAVRTPSFLAFEYLLRDSVKDKETRFQRAAEMMDYYMVHYDRVSAPMMYEKAGMLGDIAKPLKQYAHNSFGQFFEFLQVAKDQGRYAPLATMIGVQAAVSGLKGAMFVGEATVIVTAINSIFGSDIPTPEKLLLGWRNDINYGIKDSGPAVKFAIGNLADAMVYGGYSTALGVDVSSSVNAPSVPNMLSLPPAEFAYKAGKDSLTYAVKLAKGTVTPADEMQAWLSTTPSVARGWIEYAYTIPGQPVPRPTDKMQGNVIRTPSENIKSIISLKSIREAAENDLVRAVKNNLVRQTQERVSALGAIVGRVREGKQIDPKLIEMYVEEGGSVQGLPNAIKQAMIGQILPYEDRMLQGSMTAAKLMKLKEMKLLLDKQENEDYGITTK